MFAKAAILVLLQLAASGTDAYYTHRAFCPPRGYAAVEANPVARPFVRTTAGQVAYFGITAGIKLEAVHWLHKRGRRRLARAVAVAGIADNAAFAGYTAAHLGHAGEGQ